MTKKLPIDDVINKYYLYKSCDKVAKDYNCDSKTISRLLRKNNIKIQTRKEVASLKLKGYNDISGTFWWMIKRNAKTRNLEFNITIQYCWNLFLQQNKKCAISNIELILLPIFKISKCTASLDRIDSNKGYIEGNVQWVHKSINMMKSNMTDQEFINWCHIVSQNQIGYQ